MARDHSARVRQRDQLARKIGQRASYDRILIVSEGAKTEPNYFCEIRAAFRLHTTNVEVRHCEIGTSPIQVVQYAESLFRNGDRHKRIQARAFEQVYAVFDRDDHDSYFDALRYAAALDGRLKNDIKQSVAFRAVASVPNFELWLLLHYAQIHAPVHRDEVVRRLKEHVPEYRKGMPDAFAITRRNLDAATRRAEELSRRFTAEMAPEPYTGVGELVTRLTTLRAAP
ncbi:RloB domain-containing protein [Cupriavidus gilardii]|uniref:RloB family protein n=1 Tax=Cupriavidus gilardii TaxID=82541 RepID=UPI001EE5B058|nr:RloB family protein [Cupriavidus gilardii]MCG5261310.1 RloB family protein [Cupriavidus gilardii]MDF9428580.1 RloB domain-containing protein [Cupriavidus gilardii]